MWEVIGEKKEQIEDMESELSDSPDKKVNFEDWMGGESDEEGKKKRNNFDKIFADDKFSKREKKGHLLLQL